MIDLGFLLFYTFLISFFSFHRFLFKNLQDWTLNGKIVDSFFSHPIFLSLFLFKNLQFQLWLVRSWIPTFLMPFPFQSFFSNSSKNKLWMGRCGGKGAWRTTNTRLIPSIIKKKKKTLFIVLVDSLSIVFRSCPSTALGRKNFGWSILDPYFSILFSSPFPFTGFCSKTCKTELWMVRSWIPSFLIPFSFRCFFSKTCNFNFGW